MRYSEYYTNLVLLQLIWKKRIQKSIKNSKSEIRSTKQIKMTEIQKQKISINF